MFSQFINSLPQKQNSFENFLVKGIKLPLFDEFSFDSSLAQFISSYFVNKENLVVFSSKNEGKLNAVKEIISFLRKNNKEVSFSVITNENQREWVSSVLGVDAVTCISDSSFEFLFYYNSPIELFDSSSHISAFYDYSALYDSSLYKNYVSNKLSYLPSNFLYTTICKYPKKKRLEFLFGTGESIKYLSVPQKKNCILYHKGHFNENVKRHLEKIGCEIVQTIPINLRCESFVFYDLDVNLILSVLEQVDEVVFIYTKDDFNVLSEIVKVLDGLVEVPDFILKIANRE